MLYLPSGYAGCEKSFRYSFLVGNTFWTPSWAALKGLTLVENSCPLSSFLRTSVEATISPNLPTHLTILQSVERLQEKLALLGSPPPFTQSASLELNNHFFFGDPPVLDSLLLASFDPHHKIRGSPCHAFTNSHIAFSSPKNLFPFSSAVFSDFVSCLVRDPRPLAPSTSTDFPSPLFFVGALPLLLLQ